MKPQDFNISSEKLKFRSSNVELHDTKLETKPVSYFKDALNRFTKNKASIVAAFIIAILVLFAVFGLILLQGSSEPLLQICIVKLRGLSSVYRKSFPNLFHDRSLAPSFCFFSFLGYKAGEKHLGRRSSKMVGNIRS